MADDTVETARLAYDVAVIATVQAKTASERLAAERVVAAAWDALIARVRAEHPVCCVCSQPTISGGYVCDVCFAARS